MAGSVKKLRVLQLVDRNLVPPEEYAGEDYTVEPWKAECDIQITLAELGHEVRVLGTLRDLHRIQAIQAEWKPHIAFNMLEDVYGVIAYDQNMVAFLELIGLAYTGCNPLGLQLSRDKSLTKQLLSHHRVRSPGFVVCRRRHRLRRPSRLRYPLIVKCLIEHASRGISQNSVVNNDGELADRVAFVHEQLGADAIIEEFVPGREFYVGVLGNRRLEVMPPWELIIENKPEDAPLIATNKVKFDSAYQKRLGVRTQRARDLSPEFEMRLKRISKRVYRLLHLNGYARLDFRLSGSGEPYLLEANANPHLGFGEDFAESAEFAGVNFNRLIQRILNLGLAWKEMHDIS